MEIIKIELTDGDGDLHADGLPRLIVVNVTYAGGKVKRFPWQADKSITDLFGALGNVKVETFISLESKPPKEIYKKTIKEIFGDNEKTIEKGDTVKCVKVNGQNLGPAGAGGTIFLRKGVNYEVQEVLAGGYDVVEVNGAEQRRIFAEIDEVVLVSKAQRASIAKDVTITAVRKCPSCNEDTSIPKGESGYLGACDHCKTMLRIGYHNATPKETELWQKECPGKPVPEFLNDKAEVAA